MSPVTDHNWRRLFPTPSGWVIVCTCGHECKGLDRGVALNRFFEHAESDHLAVDAEVGE